MTKISFADMAIVSCGVMSMEVRALQEEGFLDTDHVFYTTPGLHQDPRDLEKQLVERIAKAKQKVDKVLVVYGGKFCYINVREPMRTMDTIIDEQGPGVVRIDATHCMDMVASEAERESIAREVAGGESVWWMVPGWVKSREHMYRGWSRAEVNENFPRHTGGAIVLDAVGYMDRLMAEDPEAFLDYSDWMGIPLQGYPVTLDRFKALLAEAAEQAWAGS